MESNFVEIFGMVTGIIITLGLCAMFVLIVYFPTKARNQERMALIEKDVDVKDLYRKREKSSGNGFFKTGIILIGVALGLFFGFFMSKVPGMPEPMAYMGMILLLGGVAVLVANYFVEKKKQ